ncbi:TIGR02147 family protein [Bdellovibrio sp. HCB290]|uniref:TIGR02147 family protein n=1 Tax=Bdellovibrio sp. HCB290 TaxID=3394356 RepID=UPI0039B69E0F
MTKTTLKKPLLRDYLSVSYYLHDLYQYRKATEEQFSYESWAQELGFQHRSFLRQVVIGRRALTEKTARQICERLFFTPSEQEHFMILAHYSKSRSAREREAFGKRLIQLLEQNYYQTEIEAYEEFVSSPLFPRLQVLLALGEEPKTPEAMTRFLNADPLQVAKGLMILTKLGLATSSDAGYKATVGNFKVPSNLGSNSLLEYHKESLQEAITARSLPHHLRRYKSMILAMSQEEFELFLKNMDGFVKEQLHKFDTTKADGRRLFQVNMNLFSVSEELQ